MKVKKKVPLKKGTGSSTGPARASDREEKPTKSSVHKSKVGSGTAVGEASGNIPKSIENVSASMRKRVAKSPIGELYKSHHNLGRRQAAQRVGSYDEADVLISYTDGYFSQGKSSSKRSSNKNEGERDDGAASSSYLDDSRTSAYFDSEDERPTYRFSGSGTSVAKVLKYDGEEKTKKKKSDSAAAVMKTKSVAKTVKNDVGKSVKIDEKLKLEKESDKKIEKKKSEVKSSDVKVSDTMPKLVKSLPNVVSGNVTKPTSSSSESKMSVDVKSSSDSSTKSRILADESVKIKPTIKLQPKSVRYLHSSLAGRKVSSERRNFMKGGGMKGNKLATPVKKRTRVTMERKDLESSAILSDRPKREANLNAGAFMSLMIANKREQKPGSPQVTTASKSEDKSSALTSPNKDSNLPRKMLPNEASTSKSKSNAEKAAKNVDIADKETKNQTGSDEITLKDRKSLASAKVSQSSITSQSKKTSLNPNVKNPNEIVSQATKSMGSQIEKSTTELEQASKSVTPSKNSSKTAKTSNMTSEDIKSTTKARPSLNKNTTETVSQASKASVGSSLVAKSSLLKKKGRLSCPVTQKSSLVKLAKKRGRSIDAIEEPKLPKRVASLNAQAILAASLEDWTKKPKKLDSDESSKKPQAALLPTSDTPSSTPTASSKTSQTQSATSSSVTSGVTSAKKQEEKSKDATGANTAKNLDVSTPKSTLKSSKVTSTSEQSFQTPASGMTLSRQTSSSRRKSSAQKLTIPPPFLLVDSPTTQLPDPRVQFAGTCSEVPSQTPNKEILEMKTAQRRRKSSDCHAATKLSYSTESPGGSPSKSGPGAVKGRETVATNVADVASTGGKAVSGSAGSKNEGSLGAKESTAGKQANFSPDSDKSMNLDKSSIEKQKDSGIVDSTSAKKKSGKSRKSIGTGKGLDGLSSGVPVSGKDTSSNMIQEVNNTAPVSIVSSGMVSNSAAIPAQLAARSTAGPQQSYGYFTAPLPAHSSYNTQQTAMKFGPQQLQQLQQQGGLQQQYQYSMYPVQKGVYAYQNGTPGGTTYPSVASYPVGIYTADSRYSGGYHAAGTDYRPMAFQQYAVQPKQYQAGFGMYEGGQCLGVNQFVPVLLQPSASVDGSTAMTQQMQAFNALQKLSVNTVQNFGPAGQYAANQMMGQAASPAGNCTANIPGNVVGTSQAKETEKLAISKSKNVTNAVAGGVQSKGGIAKGPDQASTKVDAMVQSNAKQKVLPKEGGSSKDCAVQVRSKVSINSGNRSQTGQTADPAVVSTVTSPSGASVPLNTNSSSMNGGSTSNESSEIRNNITALGVGLIPYQISSSTNIPQSYFILAGPTGNAAGLDSGVGSTASNQPISVAVCPESLLVHPGNVVLSSYAQTGPSEGNGAVMPQIRKLGEGDGTMVPCTGVSAISCAVPQSKGSVQLVESSTQSTSSSGIIATNKTVPVSKLSTNTTTIPSLLSINTSAPLSARSGGLQTRAASTLTKILPKQTSMIANGAPTGGFVQSSGPAPSCTASAPDLSEMQMIMIGPGQLLVETYQDKELDLSRKSCGLLQVSPMWRHSDTLDLTKTKKKKSPKPQTSLQLPDVLMSTRVLGDLSSVKSSVRAKHKMPKQMPKPGQAGTNKSSDSSSADDCIVIEETTAGMPQSGASNSACAQVNAGVSTSTGATVALVESGKLKKRKQKMVTIDTDKSLQHDGMKILDGVNGNSVTVAFIPADINSSVASLQIPASTPVLYHTGAGLMHNGWNTLSTESVVLNQTLSDTSLLNGKLGGNKISAQNLLSCGVLVGSDGTLAALSLEARNIPMSADLSVVETENFPHVIQYGKKSPTPGISGNPDGNPKSAKGTKRKSDTEVEMARKKSKQVESGSAGKGFVAGKSGKPVGSGKGKEPGRKGELEEGKERKGERSPQPSTSGAARRLDESAERKEKGVMGRKTSDDTKRMTPTKRMSMGHVKWSWAGEGEVKPMYTTVDGPPVSTTCYPAVRHSDGDVISVRDCVLVKSGMRKKDIPYVAKIYGLWESETGEMLMGVLWYYRLEHTETQPLPRYVSCEVFASRHRDVIPVACIEDRCYVLTLNQFNRYKASLKKAECFGVSDPPKGVTMVPGPPSDAPLPRLPPLQVDQETVFLCRHIYDVKLKRILKNPQIHAPPSSVAS